jgi:hypothetical protein
MQFTGWIATFRRNIGRIYPEDEGSMHVWNVARQLPDYMASTQTTMYTCHQ